MWAACTSMQTAASMTIPYTKPPVMAFIILRYPSPLVEKREIIAVCRPRIDIMADTKFSTLAAERIGLPSFRNLLRLITDVIMV